MLLKQKICEQHFTQQIVPLLTFHILVRKGTNFFQRTRLFFKSIAHAHVTAIRLIECNTNK